MLASTPTQGSDTIYASVNYAIAAGSQIEYLRANAGTSGLTLTGNAFSHTIIGGVGNDTLNGGAGNDVFTGNAGNDKIKGGGNNSLNGGVGTDTMAGGIGNDSYFVDNAADVVTEAAGQGSDTIYASVNYALSQVRRSSSCGRMRARPVCR